MDSVSPRVVTLGQSFTRADSQSPRYNLPRADSQGPRYRSPNFSRPRKRSKYMRKSPSSEYHGC